MSASPGDLCCCDVSTDLQAQCTRTGKTSDGLLYVMAVSHLPPLFRGNKSDVLKYNIWEPTRCVALLHFTGQLERPGKLPYTKRRRSREEQGGTGKGKMVTSTTTEGKKPEVLEGFLWFSTSGNTGWCQFRHESKKEAYSGKMLYIYLHPQRIYEHTPHLLARKVSYNRGTPHQPAAFSLAPTHLSCLC